MLTTLSASIFAALTLQPAAPSIADAAAPLETTTRTERVVLVGPRQMIPVRLAAPAPRHAGADKHAPKKR